MGKKINSRTMCVTATDHVLLRVKRSTNLFGQAQTKQSSQHQQAAKFVISYSEQSDNMHRIVWIKHLVVGKRKSLLREDSMNA